MISDKERREVAANIRSAAERRKYDLQDDSDYSPFTALYVVFCGVHGLPHYEDLLHLADLIDCPTCRNLAVKPVDEFLCSECGEHVDIAYVDSCDDYHAKYCPNCGAEVVNDA